MTPGVFLSYSTRDRAELDNLLSALRRADEEVWFDEELGGGDVWWQKILERIRDCEVFLFALSNNSLQSKPCLTELRYAQALQKPVLPIQIGPVSSLRVTPLAAVEVVDFQTPTVDSGIRLVTAVQRAKQLTAALPSPLPEEPPVPFGYLMRLATTISGDRLEAQQQAAILSEIEAVIAQDGDGAAEDIAQLLRSLHGRPDSTEATRTESERLLAALGNTSGASHPASPEHTVRSRKWLIAAVAAVAVAIAAVATVVVTRERPTPAATPAAAPTSAPVDPPSTAIPVPAAKLVSTLLSAADVNVIMGATGMQGDPPSPGLYPSPAVLSDPDCLGADYAAAEPVYKDTGYLAAETQILSQSAPDSPDDTVFWLSQAAVNFPTAQQSQDFLNNSAKRWMGCSGRVVKETSDGGDNTWTFGEMSRDRDKDTLSQISYEEGGTDWECQHTLTAYSNTVLEAVACSHNITDEASRIVAKMVEKAKA